MIDSRLLTFITLAEVKNFTKTASILNITQPAVSQHIKYLQDYYEVTLIEKHGKQMNLTEEGKLLLKYALDIQSISKNIKRKLLNTSSIIKTYNMGATLTIGGYVLPEILGEYKKSYKNIDIHLQVHNTENIVKKIVNEELDLALVEGPFNKGKLEHTKLKDDELVLAVSPAHHFASRNEITIKELLDGNLILREKGSGTRDILENELFKKGVSINTMKVYMEIGDINAIISLIKSNLGYSIISKEAIKASVETEELVIVPVKNLKIIREFNFIYSNNAPKNFINKFIEFCKKQLK